MPSQNIRPWTPEASLASPCPGVQISRTPQGIAVLHVHYTARPDMRDPAMVERERRRYPSAAYWEKEMEMRAHALSGSLVYPEFDKNLHVIPDEQIPKRGCRYMAIDPHPRTPHAFLWILIDWASDWYVYRELWPSVVYGQSGKIRDDQQDNAYTIKEYVETAANLEGNEIDFRYPDDDKEMGTYRELRGGEKIITRYMDQAGKAFQASAEGEARESYWQRYDRYGFYCFDPRKQHDVGEDAIRGLLKPRYHEGRGLWPKLHIGASNVELILEMQRHRYASSRPNEEKELKQKGAEVRRHMVDLLRYLATADIRYIPSLVS